MRPRCGKCSPASASTAGVLAVVDQPASIGALAIAVARDMGIDIAYLPGLAMRRIGDLYPGQAKTDARDAFIIADAARTMPHTLRRVGGDDETLAGLGVLAGYDDDLSQQNHAPVQPAPRRAAPHPPRPWNDYWASTPTAVVSSTSSSPRPLRRLWPPSGRTASPSSWRPRSPRLAKTLPALILTALAEQTVTVAGTSDFGRVIGGVARQLREGPH